MSNSRERNDRGQFVETITPAAVVDVLRRAETPVVTAKEVGEELGYTSEAARQKLLTLLDEGTVARRKVGGGAVVWWLTAESPQSRQLSIRTIRCLPIRRRSRAG
ncbi:hypothetical protein ACFQJ8_26325 [Halocatena marina]|uniref:hypothetical protein n=1 Tax=Halocatena marina TaxID=2934937 RepID=UPI0036171119